MAIDVGSMMGLASSLKAATDIAKTMVGLRDETMFQTKAAELVSLIMSANSSALNAQMEQSALLQEKRALEEKLMKAENWHHEAQRYALREITPGAFVYALKQEMAEGEPPHTICANCYSGRRKTVLQLSDSVHDTCPHCNSRIRARESQGGQRSGYRAVGGRSDGWMA